jgi:hypothetical protein
MRFLVGPPGSGGPFFDLAAWKWRTVAKPLPNEAALPIRFILRRDFGNHRNPV